MGCVTENAEVESAIPPIVDDSRLDVQQNLHFPFYFCHSEQVTAGILLPEIRRVFDFRPREIEHFGNTVDYDSHQNRTTLALHLSYDNARALCVFRRIQTELEAQVDDRHDLTA